MKVKSILTVCTVLLFAFSSCKESVVEPEPPVISAEAITVSADAHTDKLSYTVSNPIEGEVIEAESNVEWIHDFDYSVENTISFAVDANQSDERSGIITLSYPSAENVSVVVTQMAAGESIALDPENLLFLSDGGELTVKVNSDRAWVMSGSSDWVTASAESGEPGAEVVFTAQPNTSDEPREASFDFISGGNKVVLEISQSFAGRIIVEQAEYVVSGEAHSFEVAIQSNMVESTVVEIPEDADWITLDETKAMEEMTFNFIVTENDGDENREVILVFSNPDVSEQVKIIQEPSYPSDVLSAVEDERFRAYLAENFDTNGDGAIDKDEAYAVLNINFDGSSYDPPVSSLAGVEYFDKLESLTLTGHAGVTELNLGEKLNLKTLNLSSCSSLVGVNVVAPALESINIGLCSQLGSFDFADMPGLTSIIAYSSGLAAIDVTANTKLNVLSIGGTDVTSIDLSNNTELVDLTLPGVTSLDISACTKLQELSVSSAALNSLDLSNNTELISINVDGCGFTSLDHSMCSDVESIVYNNCANLTTIDVSKNRRLTYLSALSCFSLTEVIMFTGQDELVDTWGCGEFIKFVDPELPEDLIADMTDENLRKAILNEYDMDGDGAISASEGASITYIDCSGRGIKVIDGLDYLENITTLYAGKNEITSVDLHFQKNLHTLDLSNNQLTTIDLSGCQDITTLNLSNNQLTSVDNLPKAAITVNISNNQLETLSASYMMSLENLNVSNNKLTELDIHYDTALTDLNFSKNNLTEINIWSLSALVNLTCSDNPLENIGTIYNGSQMHYLVNLQSLICDNTNVKELDFRYAPSVVYYVQATGCPNLTRVIFRPDQTYYECYVGDAEIVRMEVDE